MVISNSWPSTVATAREADHVRNATPDVEIDAMRRLLARTPAVRDVVVSGGDPLTYSTQKLERILAKLARSRIWR